MCGFELQTSGIGSDRFVHCVKRPLSKTVVFFVNKFDSDNRVSECGTNKRNIQGKCLRLSW